MPFCSTAVDRLPHHRVLVEELVGLLFDQHVVRVRDRHPARRGAPAERLAENVAQIDHPHLGARHAGDLEGRQRRSAFRDLDLDLLVVELALAQQDAEFLPRLGARLLAHQRVEHALLGGDLRLGLDLLALARAHHVDRDLDQVADDLLHVAADIADLGELCRLDLEERRLGEAGEAARDLGLADAGRADHQDVLGQDLVAQIVVELLAPPAVAQRDGDRALGVVLSDDVAVEFGDDLAGAEIGQGDGMLSMTTLSLV